MFSIITRNTSSSKPIKAITGVGPHPGTTFPWPELPMDLSKDPSGVFCPMGLVLQKMGLVTTLYWYVC